MNFKIIAVASFIFPTVAVGECWVIGNIEGWSASSFNAYEFDDDSFQPMLMCFSDDSGTVTGNDLALVRLGPSTLLGWASNEGGLETVNTYQLDRELGKLMITQSRIGTASITTALPDYAAVFVGDAVPAPK